MSIYTQTARFDTGRALTETEMRHIAPSIFAVTAHESRSERFKPIPTIEVLRGLMQEGFMPVGAKQSRSRTEDKADFTKHLIRLRRIDDGKGTGMLAEYFATYKDRHPGPVRLVLAGRVYDQPPAHPDIDVIGEVDDDTLAALYRSAMGFVHPSGWESFSIVLMDAWENGLPVMVNGGSDVMREHCRRSGGGLWWTSYATFEVGLDRLLRDERLRAALGAAGRAYVEEHYRWPALIERYKAFMEGVAART